MLGVLYSEVPDPARGMIDRGARTFEPNGLYQYRSQLCTSRIDYCGRLFQGTGEYRAALDQSGDIFFVISHSDESRDHQCVSEGARVDPDGSMTNLRTGARLQRIR
jgi:hypothetical protein